MEFDKPPEELLAIADVFTAALVLVANDAQRESLFRLFESSEVRVREQYGDRAAAFLGIATEFIRQRSVGAHLLDTPGANG